MSIGLDLITQKVREFHTAFNHPVADKINPISLGRGTSRAIWTGEEALVEFIHQTSENEEEFLGAYQELLEGLERAKQKSLAMPYNTNSFDTLIGQMDAIVDAFYFLAGTCVEIGISPQALFEIVQAANMAKLGADGKPIIRELDGKIMKPEGWVPPEKKLAEEIARQINAQSL